jgi:beta-fructofuranosidase
MGILYRPTDGVAADFIPLYWNGAYHLFYLKDYRDPAAHGEGTPWFHLVTRDFVHFEELGEALPCGTADEQDRWVFTGSALAAEGKFHIFYTGHNRHFKGTGRPVEAVMHAVSDDLTTWRKDADFPPFLAPTGQGYEADDWRDPFVFWNPQAGEAGEYWMLLAAHRADGPPRRRGVTALAASTDLRTWQVRPPLWAPQEFYTHECPDLFRIGDWWYLVFSEFSDRSATRYRMSRSLEGPWLAADNDALDCRAWYAAKTAGDPAGRERFAFGWLSTRDKDADEGNWQWGGNLVVHQVRQRPDGSLAATMPETVRAAFTRPVPLAPRPLLGEWRIDAARCQTDAVGRFAVVLLGQLPAECLIETEILPTAGAMGLGLMLRTDAGLESGLQVRIEPAARRLVVDPLRRGGKEPAFEFERPVTTRPGQPIALRVLVDGPCIVIYANDELALSFRRYDPPAGELALFVTEGQAAFANTRVLTRE